MIIRWGTEADEPVLQAVDRLISEEKLLAALSQKRILMAVEGETLLGWLRFGWFWDSVPFMNLLFILAPYRHRGIGATLVWYWEEHMRAQGYRQVLTSTRADEEAQHFYRHLNYRDAGVLLLKDEPAELLLLKELTEI